MNSITISIPSEVIEDYINMHSDVKLTSFRLESTCCTVDWQPAYGRNDVDFEYEMDFRRDLEYTVELHDEPALQQMVEKCDELLESIHTLSTENDALRAENQKLKAEYEKLSKSFWRKMFAK